MAAHRTGSRGRLRHSRSRVHFPWLGLATVLAGLGCSPRTLLLLPEEQLPSASNTGGTGASASDPETGGVGSGGDGGSTSGVKPRVALIVDAAPNDDDETFLSRLTALGFLAEPHPQADASAENLAFADIVVVSPSADGKALGTSLVDLAKPELILEPSAVEAQLLGAVLALTTAKTRVDIVSPTSPLASGREGTLELCSTASLKVGNLAPDGATVVATAALNANAAVLYSLPAGLEIKGAALPEDRVVYSAMHGQACRSDLAWEFFDASVEWLLRDVR